MIDDKKFFSLNANNIFKYIYSQKPLHNRINRYNLYGCITINKMIQYNESSHKNLSIPTI